MSALLEDAKIEGARGILVNVTGGTDFCLSEYEEVLKIITASADSEALVIAGTSINELLADELRVTVIATGFNPERSRRPAPVAVAAASASGEKGKGDIISYEEWVKLRKGVASGRPAGDFLLGRNSREADLNVPTVLREKKLMPQGDG